MDLQKRDRNSTTSGEAGDIGEKLSQTTSTSCHSLLRTSIERPPNTKTTQARLRATTRDRHANNWDIIFFQLVHILFDVEIGDIDQFEVIFKVGHHFLCSA